MYHIKCRLGVRLHAGNILRDEKDLSVNYINTPVGIHRFLEEQTPFVSLVIRDQSGKEITNEFVAGLKFVKSRSNAPLVGGTFQEMLR